MADIGALAALETASFLADRLLPRSFRRLVGATTAVVRVARFGDDLAGYYLLLFRGGSSVARLYSIAVDYRHRGVGLAGRLVKDAERMARKRGRSLLRLEVREDNHSAVRLYRRLGYRTFGRYQHYYADGADALRCEKSLGRRAPRVPGGADKERRPRDAGASAKHMHTGRGGLASMTRRDAGASGAPSFRTS